MRFALYLLFSMYRKRVYPFQNRGVSNKRSKLGAPTKVVRGFRNSNVAYPRGPSRGGTLTQQVRSLQRVVRRIQPEIRYADVALDATNVNDATGSVIHMTAIAVGDSQNNRTGNSIRVRSLHLGGFWTGTSSQGGCRFAIVQDTQQVADGTPAVTAIFENVIPENVVTQRTNLGRFKLLYLSKYFEHLMMSSGVLVPTMSRQFEWDWSGDIPVTYNGDASTDIQRNGLYCIVLSSDTTDTTDFNCGLRIGFTDA